MNFGPITHAYCSARRTETEEEVVNGDLLVIVTTQEEYLAAEIYFSRIRRKIGILLCR